MSAHETFLRNEKNIFFLPGIRSDGRNVTVKLIFALSGSYEKCSSRWGDSFIQLYNLRLRSAETFGVYRWYLSLPNHLLSVLPDSVGQPDDEPERKHFSLNMTSAFLPLFLTQILVHRLFFLSVQSQPITWPAQGHSLQLSPAQRQAKLSFFIQHSISWKPLIDSWHTSRKAESSSQSVLQLRSPKKTEINHVINQTWLTRSYWWN